jgi:ribonuclease-3
MEAVVAAVFLGSGLGPVLSIVDRFLGDAFARAAAGTLDRDFKTQLQELAQSRLRSTPRYRVVAEHGPDHSKIFEVETDLRGEVVGRGAGRSKKDAEQAAAKLALDTLARRFAGEATPAPPAPAPVPATPVARGGADGVAEQPRVKRKAPARRAKAGPRPRKAAARKARKGPPRKK